MTVRFLTQSIYSSSITSFHETGVRYNIPYSSKGMQSDDTLKPCVVEKGEWLEIRFFLKFVRHFDFWAA